MEKDNKEKLRILHIGPDPEFTSPIEYENYWVEIETLDNPFSVSQWIVQNRLPDALIYENELPSGNGLEFHDFWVAQFDTERKIPFILLEEETNQETVSNVSARKIDGVFIKPVHVESLISSILMLRKDKPLNHQTLIIEMNGFKSYQLTILKRLFDIVMASICLIIASPILLIAAIAIKLETKGNVFYRSKRVGSGFKVFDSFKLRSMYAHSDKRLKELAHINEYIKETSDNDTAMSNPESKTFPGDKNKPVLPMDSRITKVGKIIRKLNIDELPQLFNVIKGDISMVGNRPLPIYEAELLTIEDWNDRFQSPAGITGIWKVVSRRKLRSMSHEERSRLQNKYYLVARHRNSFWNDIWIIIQTLPVLFKKGNA